MRFIFGEETELSPGSLLIYLNKIFRGNVKKNAFTSSSHPLCFREAMHLSHLKNLAVECFETLSALAAAFPKVLSA